MTKNELIKHLNTTGVSAYGREELSVGQMAVLKQNKAYLLAILRAWPQDDCQAVFRDGNIYIGDSK